MRALLALAIVASSAALYEGHNLSGLLSSLFALFVCELGSHPLIYKRSGVFEVALSVVFLVTTPSDLSALSCDLALGCLPVADL